MRDMKIGNFEFAKSDSPELMLDKQTSVNFNEIEESDGSHVYRAPELFTQTHS
jgi:hypothetical protein